MVSIGAKNLKKNVCVYGTHVPTFFIQFLPYHLGPAIEEQISSLANCMKSICLDPTANEILRTICIQSLGVCVYISVDVCNHFEITRYSVLQLTIICFSILRLVTNAY